MSFVPETIDIVISDADHPVNSSVQTWMATLPPDKKVKVYRSTERLMGGDILFLISCSQIVTGQTRALYKRTFVIHASDLPQGRGWSPHIWKVLEGGSEIVVTLLEAEDEVDTGDIWAQTSFVVEKFELWDEINQKLFQAEVELMDQAVHGLDDLAPRSQGETGISYYKKRKPEDSMLDPDMSIRQQFDLMRVCDPNRFPRILYNRRQEIHYSN